MALRPKYNGVYPGTTPRALLISAYKNVSVNNFTAIGDSDFSKLANGKTDSNLPAIAVQFMSENVILNNITVTGLQLPVKILNSSAEIIEASVLF